MPVAPGFHTTRLAAMLGVQAWTRGSVQRLTINWLEAFWLASPWGQTVALLFAFLASYAEDPAASVLMLECVHEQTCCGDHQHAQCLIALHTAPVLQELLQEGHVGTASVSLCLRRSMSDRTCWGWFC